MSRGIRDLDRISRSRERYIRAVLVPDKEGKCEGGAVGHDDLGCLAAQTGYGRFDVGIKRTARIILGVLARARVGGDISVKVDTVVGSDHERAFALGGDILDVGGVDLHLDRVRRGVDGFRNGRHGALFAEHIVIQSIRYVLIGENVREAQRSSLSGACIFEVFGNVHRNVFFELFRGQLPTGDHKGDAREGSGGKVRVGRGKNDGDIVASRMLGRCAHAALRIREGQAERAVPVGVVSRVAEGEHEAGRIERLSGRIVNALNAHRARIVHARESERRPAHGEAAGGDMADVIVARRNVLFAVLDGSDFRDRRIDARAPDLAAVIDAEGDLVAVRHGLSGDRMQLFGREGFALISESRGGVDPLDGINLIRSDGQNAARRRGKSVIVVAQRNACKGIAICVGVDPVIIAHGDNFLRGRAVSYFERARLKGHDVTAVKAAAFESESYFGQRSGTVLHFDIIELDTDRPLRHFERAVLGAEIEVFRHAAGLSLYDIIVDGIADLIIGGERVRILRAQIQARNGLGHVLIALEDPDLCGRKGDGVAVLNSCIRSAHLNGELLHVYLARLDGGKSIVKVTGLIRVEHEIVIILARVDIARAVADRGRDRGHERLILLVPALEDDRAHNIVGGDSLGVIGVELPRRDLYLIRIDRPSEGSGDRDFPVVRGFGVNGFDRDGHGHGVSSRVSHLRRVIYAAVEDRVDDLGQSSVDRISAEVGAGDRHARARDGQPGDVGEYILVKARDHAVRADGEKLFAVARHRIKLTLDVIIVAEGHASLREHGAQRDTIDIHVINVGYDAVIAGIVARGQLESERRAVCAAAIGDGLDRVVVLQADEVGGDSHFSGDVLAVRVDDGIFHLPFIISRAELVGVEEERRVDLSRDDLVRSNDDL